MTQQSPEARELLRTAVGSNGMIMVVQTLEGLFVEAGHRRFVDSQNPQSVAMWLAAIQELLGAGLIEAAGDRIYRATQAGYQAVQESRA